MSKPNMKRYHRYSDLERFYYEELNKPLDSELEALFFPVEERDVYWEKDERKQSNNPSKPEFTDRYFAIVDKERNSLFTIVSESYDLVTNIEAYFISRAIARYMFRSDNSNDNFEFVPVYHWINKNRSVCEISIGRKLDINQPKLNDGWIAGITMLNSYNKTVALTYYVGFFRENSFGNRPLCLLLPENLMSLKVKKDKYNNMFSQIEEQLMDLEEKKRIQDMEQSFMKKLDDLKNIAMDGDMFMALFCKFFHITKQRYNNDEAREMRNFVKERKNLYIREYGENAYAFLLAISDYISNYEYFHLRINFFNYQTQAGQWVNDYLKESTKDDFSPYRYIGEEAFDTAHWLNTL